MIAAAPVVVGGVVITAAGVAAFFSGASLAIDIYDKVTGQYELTQQWWKYDRTIITKYRGVDIEQRWLAEQPSVGANWKYRYTCKSEQFSENKYIDLRNEFSIAHNGSSLGDVPLEVRNSSCGYYVQNNYDSGPNPYFVGINRTEFHVRCNLSWKTNPWSTPASKRIALILLNWTPELQECEEASRYRSTSAPFPGEVPANGWGNIAVRSYWLNGSMIQLSSGEGAGLGVK